MRQGRSKGHRGHQGEPPPARERHLLVGVQVRAVGEHLRGHRDPARLQLYLLRLLPVVEDAAAQPGGGRAGSPSRGAR